MERSGFLRSLYFLVPVASTDWPLGLGRVERVVRKELSLSLEAVYDDHLLGPVYTQPSSASEDWALTSLDMIVEHIQLPKPRKSQQTPDQQSPSLPEEQVISRVFLRIEQMVFELVLSQILKIRVEDSDQQKPASLVVQFAGCWMRIFGDGTSAEELRAIMDQIKKVQRFSLVDLPLFGSTARGSGEHGSARWANKSTQSHKRTADSTVEHRQTAFHQSREKLERLDDLARGKQSVALQSSEDAASLLNGLAEDIAHSYPKCEVSTVQPSMEPFQEKLEKTLNSFFPDRRNKQRRNSWEPTASPEATVAAVHSILRDHQLALDEKFAEKSLPSRD